MEGIVKRGIAQDVDLSAENLILAPTPGAAGETIPYSKVKALFFLLQPGAHPEVGTGKRVKVTFADGRQVDGFLGEEAGQGFFLFPLDARSNTSRVYVLNHAVRSVV